MWYRGTDWCRWGRLDAITTASIFDVCCGGGECHQWCGVSDAYNYVNYGKSLWFTGDLFDKLIHHYVESRPLKKVISIRCDVCDIHTAVKHAMVLMLCSDFCCVGEVRWRQKSLARGRVYSTSMFFQYPTPRYIFFFKHCRTDITVRFLRRLYVEGWA